MTDTQLNLSFSSIWQGLSAPVLALAEDMALRRAAVTAPPMLLSLRPGGVDAIRVGGAGREILASAAGRPQQAVKEIVQRGAAGLGPDVAIGFSEDQAVSQTLVLPQQPDDVLRAIVRNKVESLAPWPLAQCLWGMRASPVAGDPQHMSVEVAVVSRALLDELAATLRQAGAEVKALAVALPGGGEVEIALGSGDIRREARIRAVRRAKAAAALALLLVGLGLFWVYRTSADAVRIEAETSSLMASLKPNGTPAGEPPLVSAANRVYEARRERLPVVAILDEVSKLLPANVHLVSLSLDGEQLTIRGQGSGVPDLIEVLEASPAFQSVNFAAATELDQNSNADAFSLIATLEKAPPPEAAP